ncbi:MAG: hypothetical protein ACD_3C00214G0002 [uncultured bacterium (gcode 4)]|uniref:ATPase AAA-type core domain-containing protein n=1 Tax=uncultured bacterium (gcode 4) TaxID=1234023 RepID=K2F889_9BACT|nr:MAG: hypothetical protein ACD_3C00214G0002 [uncultured bacterium (gcode 4)]
MHILMENSRFGQIRGLNMRRKELVYHIEWINKPIIAEIWEENLNRFILEKISELSLNDIENIRIKLLNFEWVRTPKALKLVQIFYTLLTKRILLPDSVDKKDYWKLKEVLGEIVDRYNKKLNQRITKLDDSFFNISTWDIESQNFELEIEWEVMPRDFKIWGIFWNVSMWFNEKEERYAVEIPVKLTVKKDSVEQKFVNADEIKALLAKYFPKKRKAGDRFAEFKYKSLNKVDRDEKYWTNPDTSYFVITVYHTKHKDLSTINMDQDDISNTLKDYIDLTNWLINDIAKLSSINHGIKHYSFYSSFPFLYVEWDSSLKEEIDQKFSKLLVKMQKPVYMADIWWNEKSKKDINKIILWLKHRDVMELWWWKTTTWALLYWPPWTGKTLLAMVIATEVNADIYNIKMTDIAETALINDGAKNIKYMFDFIRHKAKENPNKKNIIVLDEMDALLKKRTWERQSDEDIKIVNTFLAEMNWFDTIDNVIFIWTTNNYHKLDWAVKRSWRFSTKIKIELPDDEWRKEIFSIHINKAKKAAKRREIFAQVINLSELSRNSESLSWADIEEIIRMTIEDKAIEQINKIWTWEEVDVINEADIIRSINEMKSSNWKANEIIKSFSKEWLSKELKWPNQEYLREAIYKVFLEKTSAELNGAVDSGKISTALLLEIFELTLSGWKQVWF